MSRICAVCGKRPQVANMVSHAKNRTKKWVYPNVQKMRYTLTECTSGHVHADTVCTKCIKSKKITKVI